MAQFIPGNSGRRYGVAPAVTPSGPRVRLPVQSPQGRVLGTVSDSMTTTDATLYALQILAAVAVAEHAHNTEHQERTA